MNNRENLKMQIKDFIKNDNEKIILISGTYQNEKHREVLRTVNSIVPKGAKVLFRANSMDNIGGFINNPTINIKTKKLYRSGNLNMYFDSINRSSWDVGARYNISILYPLDSVCRMKENRKKEIINDLLRKTVHKVFLVTWTDDFDYNGLDEFNIDRKVVFDAEEEDLAYHKRVLSFLEDKY